MMISRRELKDVRENPDSMLLCPPQIPQSSKLKLRLGEKRTFNCLSYGMA
jgi:hypothetical protein